MAPKKKVAVVKVVKTVEIDENEDVSSVYIGMAMQRFDPMLAELNASAEKAKAITEIDVTDKAQVENVHTVRMELLKHRTNLAKIGKMLRVIPNNLKDAISAKEKELIAIVSGEEDRLTAMEDEAKNIVIKAERLAKLPERWERIKALEIETETTDEYLLGLDAQGFETYFNACVAEKNRRATEEIERTRQAESARLEKAAKEVEEAKLALEKRELALTAEEDARKRVAEATKQAEAEAKRKDDERIALEKKTAEDALKSEAEVKAKMEKREEYKRWRADTLLAFSPKDAMKHEERNTGDVVELWVKVGEFKIK